MGSGTLPNSREKRGTGGEEPGNSERGGCGGLEMEKTHVFRGSVAVGSM